METPIISLADASFAEAQLEFYHAFYFCSGAEGRIELSFDGGNSYDLTLDTILGDSGIVMDQEGGNCSTNSNGDHPTNDGYDFYTLDLSAYIGLSGLRIRFSFDADAPK